MTNTSSSPSAARSAAQLRTENGQLSAAKAASAGVVLPCSMSTALRWLPLSVPSYSRTKSWTGFVLFLVPGMVEICGTMRSWKRGGGCCAAAKPMPPAMSSATAVVRDQEIRMAGLGKMGSRCVGQVTLGCILTLDTRKKVPTA